MIRTKVCMLGSFAVGKTSLVRRFVHSLFGDRYLSTLGARVDKKSLVIDGTKIDLMLWDLAGKDDYQSVRPTHLRGASGCLLVMDSTREHSVDVALELHQLMLDTIDQVSFVVAINKCDLVDEWRLSDRQLEQLRALGGPIFRTSALTGDEVENAFAALARQILASKPPGEDGDPS